MADEALRSLNEHVVNHDLIADTLLYIDEHYDEGAILVFLTAYNEVTVSALLWSRGSETIGTVIFNFEDGGYTALASAMATVTLAVTALLMAALTRLGRRLPRGTIPWLD